MLKSNQHRGSDSYIISINGKFGFADNIENIIKSEIQGSVGIGWHRFEAGENLKAQPSLECKKNTAIFLLERFITQKSLLKNLTCYALLQKRQFFTYLKKI